MGLSFKTSLFLLQDGCQCQKVALKSYFCLRNYYSRFCIRYKTDCMKFKLRICTNITNFPSSLLMLVVLILINISAKVNGQSREDVVYLKNGSVLRGIIVPDSSNLQRLRILNISGDIWAFSLSEIDSVKKEKPFIGKVQHFTKPGLEFGINAELLVRSGVNAIGNSVIPGVNLQLSYRYNTHFAVGTDLGLEFYNWMEIPISLGLRYRFSNTVNSPLLFIRTGYTIPAEEREPEWEFRYVAKGGWHYTAGVGIEKILNNETSFLFSLAYHYQEFNYHLVPLQTWSVERNRTEAYSRLRLNIGYNFK